MAIFETKELQGALFKSKSKTADTHSDYNGNCKINGVEYWVNAWINKPKAGGETYMSLRFKEKDTPSTPKSTAASFDEDDIPFAPYGKCGAGISWRNI
jgi:hypothetical protein